MLPRGSGRSEGRSGGERGLESEDPGNQECKDRKEQGTAKNTS